MAGWSVIADGFRRRLRRGIISIGRRHRRRIDIEKSPAITAGLFVWTTPD
ncbi:hypothetical protein [Paraburkholderia sp.]|nr:hypothetical protein [Paraburkholderia sp.]MDE1181365.1 hypothetical protein [Paraburkholderia sp.]